MALARVATSAERGEQATLSRHSESASKRRVSATVASSLRSVSAMAARAWSRAAAAPASPDSTSGWSGRGGPGSARISSLIWRARLTPCSSVVAMRRSASAVLVGGEQQQHQRQPAGTGPMPDIFVAMRNWRISRIPGPKKDFEQKSWAGPLVEARGPGGWRDIGPDLTRLSAGFRKGGCAVCGMVRASEQTGIRSSHAVVPRLAASRLACRRGDRLLFRGLDFRARRRPDRLAAAGPNGSGKTSLLRLLADLSTPARGAITWGGTPLRGRAPLVPLAATSPMPAR